VICNDKDTPIGLDGRAIDEVWRSIHLQRYDTIEEFNMYSKAQYTA